MAKKQLIRITESDLSNMVMEATRKLIKENLDEMPSLPASQVQDRYGIFGKLQDYINKINEKRDAIIKDYGDSTTCLDKEGNFYAIKAPIQLQKNGYVIISSDYGVDKYQALTKAGGVWKKAEGRYPGEGFKDVLAELKRINKDMEKYIYNIQNYNADWDEPENMDDQAKAEFKQYKKNMPR